MKLSASIMILVGLFTRGCSGKAVKYNEKNANKAEEHGKPKDVMTAEVFKRDL